MHMLSIIVLSQTCPFIFWLLMRSTLCFLSFASTYLLISFVVKTPCWVNEPSAVETKPYGLVILDVNGVLLKSFRKPYVHPWHIPEIQRGPVIKVHNKCYCVLRPDAEDFLISLRSTTSIIIWSCCKHRNLMQILNACFPNIMGKAYFFIGNLCLNKIVIRRKVIL